MAALDTPAELDGWPGFNVKGNPVDGAACTRRRDAFLRAALDRLDLAQPPGPGTELTPKKTYRADFREGDSPALG